VPDVFISYRRGDTTGHAGRLYDALSARVGKRHVFMDVDTIRPGTDFVEHIEQAVGSCDLALILIGHRWTTGADAGQPSRLDDPHDFVRLEVASALARDDVRVIPVLVEGARMPRIEDLPDSLARLPRIQAFELSDQRWQHDVDELAREAGLPAAPVRSPLRGGSRGRAIAAGLGLAAVAIVVLLVLLSRGGGGGGDATERVATCMRTHGLSESHEISERAAKAGDPFEESRRVFRSCTWPSPPGGDADGYAEIAVIGTDGPGDVEAAGDTRAFVFTTDCERLSADFVFDAMGQFKTLDPVELRQGDIKYSGGEVWEPDTPADEEFQSLPRENESVVLANGRYDVDGARCL
jgi:hypothetical protein